MKRFFLDLFKHYILLAALLISHPALSHSYPESFVVINRQAGHMSIELNALEACTFVDCDTNKDEQVHWHELQSSKKALIALLTKNFTMESDSESFAIDAAEMKLNQHSSGTFIFFDIDLAPSGLLDKDWVFESTYPPNSETNHKVFVKIANSTSTSPVVLLGRENNSLKISARSNPQNEVPTYLPYIQDGVHHIFAGYDHLCFVLLLIAGSLRAKQPGEKPGIARKELISVATRLSVFTISHTISLFLVAFKTIVIEKQVIVELIIASSLIWMSLENLLKSSNHATVASIFCLGLVHGIGFAGPLAELQVDRLTLVKAVIQFNLGVELGQVLFALLALVVLRYVSTRISDVKVLKGTSAAGILTGSYFIWTIAFP